jgi:hypothetical protein
MTSIFDILEEDLLTEFDFGNFLEEDARSHHDMVTIFGDPSHYTSANNSGIARMNICIIKVHNTTYQ